MFRTLICVVLCLLLCAAAGAEGITAEENILSMGESTMSSPVIGGMEDPALQEAVNRRIAEDGKFAEYLVRMSQLLSGGALKVSWTGGVLGDVFSCAVSAEGAVRSARPEHVWTWSSVDLRSGEEIPFSALFTDETAAREALEEYLEQAVAPELSAHLASSALTPLPEGFFVERTGLTLLYGAEQLSTLSDRAGAVRIGWNEILPVLNLEEGSILRRIGAEEMVTPGSGTREALERMAEAGEMPDIPVSLGASVQELTDRYGLLTDPDVYEGGRMFALEGAPFRGVYVLTDYLSERWENSRVSGIRADRGCMWGLCVGSTERETWRAVLGEPDSEVAFDADRAEANRTVPGSCDYYQLGENQLRLYSDENGILYSILLTE